LRFVNEKEIPCEWSLNTREGLSSENKKEEPKFLLNPTSGIITPGNKQVVEITFSPNTEKVFNHKFVLNIKENPKPFTIFVKG
jgi:hypothetical protein